jgi:ligand-binding SRPBCC domain-containing protein
MTTLTNSISIDAPIDRIWTILANVTELAEYDPTVRASELTSANGVGLDAARRVTMRDGKHWFEERVATFEPNSALAFELTACNFPIRRLRHSYSFAADDGRTTVTQVMAYTPKFGPLGRLMDAAILRRSFHAGVKQFLTGLKAHSEA